MGTARQWDHYEDDRNSGTSRIILADEVGLQIGRTQDGRIRFDCRRNEIGRALHTDDPVEAAAAFMRSRTLMANVNIWSLPLLDAHVADCDPTMALYWLSGGDREWLFGTHYRLKWQEAESSMLEAFGPQLARAVANSRTMGDVRDALVANFPLMAFYEFMLDRGWIRKK